MIPIANKIPFDNPNVLNACRAAYVASNLIIAGLYLGALDYVFSKLIKLIL